MKSMRAKESLRAYPWEREEKQLRIQIPWDPIVARSFLLSLIVTAIIILFLILFLDVTPEVREPQWKTVSIELLNFGAGAGEGLSGGNLSQEGKGRKGKASAEPLRDAEGASRNEGMAVAKREFQSGDHPKPIQNYAALTPRKTADENAEGQREVGTENGEDFGIGLGRYGEGKGRGYGYSLQWGGGGNRIVLYKELPEYPPGVKTNAQIKLRFTVRPDGSVESIIPVQKADPALEQAAIAALRRWKFNPLDTGVTMVGTITFTFTLE